MHPKDGRMFNDTDYYALYLAKLKGKELMDFYESEKMRKELSKDNNKKNGIVKSILTGAGNVMVSKGTKLLEIA